MLSINIFCSIILLSCVNEPYPYKDRLEIYLHHNCSISLNKSDFTGIVFVIQNNICDNCFERDTSIIFKILSANSQTKKIIITNSRKISNKLLFQNLYIYINKQKNWQDYGMENTYNYIIEYNKGEIVFWQKFDDLNSNKINDLYVKKP